MATVPFTPIRLDEPRYPQDSLGGRFRHFVDMTDMRTLLSSQADIDRSRDMLRAYRTAPTPGADADALWKAKQIVDACVHPDTGEVVFAPFRVSAFVPMNLVIVFGMLNPNAGIGSIVFWQWVNQSYNVAMNFANRNASNAMSTQQILGSYAAAVGISCSLAVGLNQWVKRAVNMAPAVRAVLTKAVPFIAVASAGAANVVLMRKNELDGVEVFDEEGGALGKSKVAGRTALLTTALSRITTSGVLLAGPPLSMGILEAAGLFRAMTKGRTAAH